MNGKNRAIFNFQFLIIFWREKGIKEVLKGVLSTRLTMIRFWSIPYSSKLTMIRFLVSNKKPSKALRKTSKGPSGGRTSKHKTYPCTCFHLLIFSHRCTEGSIFACSLSLLPNLLVSAAICQKWKEPTKILGSGVEWK